MADKHPYSPGGTGGVAAAITQLRKSFPKSVDADTLKKLSIAPSNEGYIINILRYIGAIDAEGNRTEKAAAVFSKPDDEFAKDFEEMIKSVYSDLFELHGVEAWKLPPDKLKAFFRSADQTSDLVGRHQANTFLSLASFAGHGGSPDAAKPKFAASAKPARPTKNKPSEGTKTQGAGGLDSERMGDFGLTVRIEVNLPAQADQETYDKIFRSIRENLLTNGK